MAIDLAALRALGASAPIIAQPGRIQRQPVSHSRELERITALPIHPGYTNEDRAHLEHALRRPSGTMRLRPAQADALLAALEAGGLFAPLAVGQGKCLGPDVKVLLYSGEIKSAQDVVVGDMLMGPDSTPRHVLSTVTGFGPMRRIIPVKGEPWECNDVHVLTVVETSTGEVADAELDVFLRLPQHVQDDCKLFQPEIVDFPPIERAEIDPYFLGLWIGDGTKLLNTVQISKPDPEVLVACQDEAARWGLQVVTNNSKSCPTYSLTRGRRGGKANPLLTTLRHVVRTDAINGYLRGSRETRLHLLAGILDADGHLTQGNFEIAQKNKQHAEWIKFLARSLGLRITCRSKYVDGKEYQRMMISGHTSRIPTRLPRKQAEERRQKKNALRTGFIVALLPDGPYCGWELDGDGRFLLGDFTVTHNTLISALLPTILDARRAVVLTTNALQVQTQRAFQAYAEHFYIREDVEVLTYSLLSNAKNHDLLARRVPNLIIADEAHALRDHRSARTKRFMRHFKEHPMTAFACLSGTLCKRSIKDYAHLLKLALKDWTPLPRDFPTLTEWAEALDPNPVRPPGALMCLCQNGEDALEGFSRRLRATRGVVSSPPESLGATLIVRVEAADTSPLIADARDHLEKTWESPQGEELDSALEHAALDVQLKLGGYFAWITPPDPSWLRARNGYKAAVRRWLGSHNKVGCDSPALLEQAVLRHEISMPEYDAWLQWSHIPEPPRHWVWIDDVVCRWAADFARKEPCIVFTHIVPVGRRVADLAGLPYYGEGRASAEAILGERGDRSMVCSLQAHGQGRNLQCFSRALVLGAPPTGTVWEQMLGRTHRSGQEADEVIYTVPDTFAGELERACDDARYIQASMGQPQKLCHATLV